MSNSMKFFLFCLVGFIVFEITGTIIEPIILVATMFLIGAWISISVYFFKGIKTKHMFLKSFLCSLIGVSLCVGNIILLNNITSNPTGFYLISKNIYNYGTIFMMFAMLTSIIILIFDVIMSLFMKFPTDRNTLSINVFKFCLCGVLSFSLAGLILNIFTIGTLLFHIATIVLEIIIIFIHTKSKISTKLLMSSISTFASCVMMFYYFYSVNTSFSVYKNLGIVDVYNYACGISLFLIFISIILLIISDIFSKFSGVSGSLVALLISIVGAGMSYVFYSFGSLLPFLPTIPVTISIFRIMFLLFILGISLSIMSIAFKLIFKGNKSKSYNNFNDTYKKY